MIAETKNTPSYLYKLLFFAIVFLVVVFSIITYSFFIGHQMTAKYAPLVDAAMEVKLEATTAHLWLEEILSGDHSEDITSVGRHIKQSKWYAKAMIDGGTNSEGVFLPIEDKKLEQKIILVINHLEEFEAITSKRYKNKNTAAGSDDDIAHDKLFKILIEEADSIETGLQRIIESELETYKFTYYFILIAAFIITFIAFILFYHYEKSKDETLRFLKKSNEELESTKKDLLKSNKIIHQLANTDKLTQLHNRLKIDAVFEYEINRAIRYRTIFSIILLDIDSFKEVNDTYGHDVGDYTLIEIACILKENIRDIDMVGRFGGEEFLIICPQTKVHDTGVLAEKLRDLIEKYIFKAIGKQTCSFGVSEFMFSDISKEEILKRADDALYEAKNSGKNKVVLSRALAI